MVLKFCTEHGSGTAVLCENFQTDWTNKTGVTDKRDFARFEFKMSFGRISYISTASWSPQLHGMGSRIFASFPYCPVQKAIHGAIQCRCLYLGTNMLLLICKGVKSNNISVMVYNISYTLSREYRVVRKRYSRLLFMNDLHVQNNRRIWRHNASTPRSRDVTDHLWWCHNAKLEKTVPSDNGEINDR